MDSGVVDYDYDRYRKLLAEKTSILTESPNPYDAYKRLAGEAEARNVQTRLDWTPEQRRATPPWETLDVPEGELIYRKDLGGLGSQMSVDLPDIEELRLFHGTNRDFEDFDVDEVGEFSSADTAGNISMTPFFDEAESYSRGGKGGSPRVIESNFKGRVKVIDDLEEHDAYEMMDIEEKAREQGFDAVYYSGIQDSSFYNPMGSTDTVKVLNPKTITQTNKNFTKDDYKKGKFISHSGKGKYSDDELKSLLKISDADIKRYRKDLGGLGSQMSVDLPMDEIKKLPFREKAKVASEWQTGQPIKLSFARNTESSKAFPSGMDFGQELEPSGRYMNVDFDDSGFNKNIPNWEFGEIEFKNPLVLEHKNTGSTGWKKDLSEMFGGSTGKRLTSKVKKAGYDGIITKDADGLFKNFMNPNKPRIKAYSQYYFDWIRMVNTNYPCKL
jgi:hypothetical protein